MIKNIAILFIKFYRNIFSNNMLHYCRFYPTCSQYAIESIEKKGIFRGLLPAIFRILRCNPLSRGGFDPIHPIRKQNSLTVCDDGGFKPPLTLIRNNHD